MSWSYMLCSWLWSWDRKTGTGQRSECGPPADGEESNNDHYHFGNLTPNGDSFSLRAGGPEINKVFDIIIAGKWVGFVILQKQNNWSIIFKERKVHVFYLVRALCKIYIIFSHYNEVIHWNAVLCDFNVLKSEKICLYVIKNYIAYENTLIDNELNTPLLDENISKLKWTDMFHGV